MDLLSNLALGFSVAFAPINMVFVTIGVILGTLIGGIVVAMYLPIFKLGQVV